MGLRTVALFEGPVVGARIRPTNPDASTPLVARQVGGIGPFDFSSAVSAAAVTITVKLDNAAVINDTIDLSGVGSISAVTVDELATAIGTSVTGYTGSKEASTGRIKFAKTTPGAAKYLQVGGEVGKLAGFGYGYGTNFVKIDTQSAIAQAPVQKDSERIEVIGSDGKTTAIITNAYRQGANITLNDTAYDNDLLAMLEGGTFVDDGYDNMVYKVPGTATKRPTVDIEWFSTLYADGDNQEDNVQGYLWYRGRCGKLTTIADIAGDRNLQGRAYTIALTPYKASAASKALSPADADDTDMSIQRLTIEEFEALDWLNV